MVPALDRSTRILTRNQSAPGEMSMLIIFGLLVAIQTAPYKDWKLPVAQRVKDLLGRMTLEEKVAQLVCLWNDKPQVGPSNGFAKDRGEFSVEKARQVLKNGIGQIARQRENKSPRDSAKFANDLQ